MADNKKKLTNKLALLRSCVPYEESVLCNRPEYTLQMRRFTTIPSDFFGAISIATWALKHTHIDVPYLAQYPIQTSVHGQSWRGICYQALESQRTNSLIIYHLRK